MSYYPGFDEAPAVTAQVSVAEDFDYRDQKTVDEELKRLSWWKKRLYRWRGQVSVGCHTPANFSAPMKFFLFQCEHCGPILTYPKGYWG